MKILIFIIGGVIFYLTSIAFATLPTATLLNASNCVCKPDLGDNNFTCKNKPLCEKTIYALTSKKKVLKLENTIQPGKFGLVPINQALHTGVMISFSKDGLNNTCAAGKPYAKSGEKIVGVTYIERQMIGLVWIRFSHKKESFDINTCQYKS